MTATHTQRIPGLTFRQRASRFDVKVSPYLYISPFFILFALIGIFPILYTLNVSLYDWHLLKGQGDFVGLSNYTDVLTDSLFWNAFGNTLSIFVLSAVPQLVFAVIIAAVLDQALRFSTFWRMSILLPFIVAPVAVAVIFTQIFSQFNGPIAGFFDAIGVDPIRWSFDVFPSHVAIASMVDWRWTGYNALILLAAMQSVPRDLYESAAIDGASRVRRFWSITIPMIRPTMIFVIITSTIGSLQIFAEPKLFDQGSAGNVYGGSNRQYQTLVLYLYELAFPRRDFGHASAVAWLLFLLIVVFGIINFLISRTIAGQDARPSRASRRATRAAAAQNLGGSQS